MDGSHWIRSVLLPLETLEALNISPFEEVLLKHSAKTSAGSQTISTILQAVPLSGSPHVHVALHPFMEEFLVCAASKIDARGNDTDAETTVLRKQANEVMLQYACQDMDGHGRGDFNSVSITSKSYQIEKLTSIRDMTKLAAADENWHLDVSLRLIYSTNEEYYHILLKSDEKNDSDEFRAYLQAQIKQGLECRTVKQGSFVPICLPPLPGISRSQRNDEIGIFYITGVKRLSPSQGGQDLVLDEGGGNHDMCYTIGSFSGISVSIITDDSAGIHETDASDIQMMGAATEITKCPGYDALVEEIIEIANITIRGGSPTGVLLSGCGGVGKTRLVSKNHCIPSFCVGPIRWTIHPRTQLIKSTSLLCRQPL